MHEQTAHGLVADPHLNQVRNDVAVNVQVLIDITPKEIMFLGNRAVRTFFVNMQTNTVV